MSEDMFAEAKSAARSGNRVRARSLLTRLLRTDSSVVDYWVWLSSAVESRREKVYCLESALKLDPTNAAALRGLAVLGARVPQPAEFAGAAALPRRSTRPRVTGPVVPGGLADFPFKAVAVGGAGLVALIVVGGGGLWWITRPRGHSLAPTLPPPSPTPSATSDIPTPTITPVPGALRIDRTPVPTELALTPIVHFVQHTPTHTPVIGLTPHGSYEAYNSGVKKFMEGEYAEALDLFNQVLGFDDGLADVHYLKGEAYRLMATSGDPELEEHPNNIIGRAILAYDEAIRRDSEFPAAYLGRGRAFLARSEFEVGAENIKAEDLPSDFDKALELDPMFLEAFTAKANFYRRVGLWKTLEETMQIAIERGLRDPVLYIRLAEAQLNRGENQLALESAVEGSGSDPTDLDGYLLLGRSLVRLERYQEAENPLLTYVAFRGADPRGWSDLGRIQLELGDLPTASESLNHALELNPRYAPAYLGRGLVNNEVGAYQTAIEDFNRARQFGPETAELYRAYGYARYYLGDLQEALDDASTSLELAAELPNRELQDRESSRSYLLRALVAEDSPDLLEYAIKNYEWILGLQFADPEALAHAEARLNELVGQAPTALPSLTPTEVPPSSATPVPTSTPLVEPTATPKPPTATPHPTPTSRHEE